MKTNRDTIHPGGQKVARRRTLAALTTGLVSLPFWLRPVVDSVVLPAHAQTTTDTDTTGLPIEPVVARLSGVEEGEIGTTFNIDASASSGPDGAMLDYHFSAEGVCIVLSQSGATAVIQRLLIAGECTVSVTVSAGAQSDIASETAPVNGGPPGLP